MLNKINQLFSFLVFSVVIVFALRFFNKKSDFEKLKFVILFCLFLIVSPSYKIKIVYPFVVQIFLFCIGYFKLIIEIFI